MNSRFISALVAVVVLGAAQWASAAPGTVATDPMRIETPEVRAERMQKRLQILLTEKGNVSNALVEAQAKLAQAPEDQNAANLVKGLQADLQALDKEISRTKQPADGRRSSKTSAATAAVEMSQGAKADTAYEAWDVFKNFPKVDKSQ